MIVHHVSSVSFGGGAARAGYRLHEALIASGCESLWLDAGESAPKREGIARLTPPPAPAKLSRWARAKERWLGPTPERREAKEMRRQTHAFFHTQTLGSASVGWGRAGVFGGLPTPDAYNLHWVAHFLHWADALPGLAARAPVFWTLHDLNPVSGAWHYDPFPEDQNTERDAWDAVERTRKAAALARVPRDRLVFIAPSRWMAKRCAESGLTRGFDVEHIPNALDTDVFRPLGRDPARAALGLSSQGRVIGFVADSLNDRRKGMAVLLAALKKSRAERGMTLLSIGSGDADADEGWIHLGPVRDDRLLRLFYSACDLFVCPSLQDNLPNTVLEAMSCGVPVVASDTGGIPDMVRPGETGWLTSPGDSTALGRGLREALADEERLADFGRRARACVLAEYGSALIAERHRRLYASRAKPRSA